MRTIRSPVDTPVDTAKATFQFRPEGIFFPFVGSYLTAVASQFAIFDPANPMRFTPEDSMTLGGVIGQPRRIYPFEIHRNAVEGHLPHEAYCVNLSIMLANTAYEAARGYSDNGPLFEFFRHIRNAGSHGNRFNFAPQEPKRPAAWRTVIIDHTRKGTANPLCDTTCFGVQLGFADVLELLWDVEQLIPPRVSRHGPSS